MTITIPDELLKNSLITEQHIKQQLALILYDKKIFSLAQARKLAEMDKWDFLNLMKEHNVYLNYDMEDMEQDFKTIHQNSESK
jgi:predicted HTH domain antitoxin